MCSTIEQVIKIYRSQFIEQDLKLLVVLPFDCTLCPLSSSIDVLVDSSRICLLQKKCIDIFLRQSVESNRKESVSKSDRLTRHSLLS